MSNFQALSQKFLVVLIIFGVVLFGVKQLEETPKINVKSNFNFIFKYGVGTNPYGALNELNIFEGIYIRDMVVDPPITVKLVLTQEELEEIYQKMVNIDFFNYPRRFPKDPNIGVSPCVRTYFKVSYNFTIKKVEWTDESYFEGDTRQNIDELLILIRDILESKEEYQNLPEPQAFYL